jgi:hypothetical protein
MRALSPAPYAHLQSIAMHATSPLVATSVPQRARQRPFIAASAAAPYNVVITGSTKGPPPPFTGWFVGRRRAINPNTCCSPQRITATVAVRRKHGSRLLQVSAAPWQQSSSGQATTSLSRPALRSVFGRL